MMFAVSVDAGAAVFKCAADSAGPIYQEFPCPAGKELRDFAVDPPPLTIVPGTRSHGATNAAQGTREAPSNSVRARPERVAKSSRAPRPNAAERRHAHAGMTDGEVLARFGRADAIAGSPRKGKARWTYLPAPGDPDTITTLLFDGGTVVNVERKTLKQ
ncbi:MAG: hypothetical protein M3Z31_14060 [Pseudomonadota bacterium]|nr:hypothetical protein [Pseudomonadota bacterium]